MTWNTIKSIQVMGERSTSKSNNVAFPGKALSHEYFNWSQYKINNSWTLITSMSAWQQDTYSGLYTGYFNSGNNYRFDIWDTRY